MPTNPDLTPLERELLRSVDRLERDFAKREQQLGQQIEHLQKQIAELRRSFDTEFPQ